MHAHVRGGSDVEEIKEELSDCYWFAKEERLNCVSHKVPSCDQESRAQSSQDLIATVHSHEHRDESFHCQDVKHSSLHEQRQSQDFSVCKEFLENAERNELHYKPGNDKDLRPVNEHFNIQSLLGQKTLDYSSSHAPIEVSQVSNNSYKCCINSWLDCSSMDDLPNDEELKPIA